MASERESRVKELACDSKLNEYVNNKDRKNHELKNGPSVEELKDALFLDKVIVLEVKFQYKEGEQFVDVRLYVNQIKRSAQEKNYWYLGGAIEFPRVPGTTMFCGGGFTAEYSTHTRKGTLVF